MKKCGVIATFAMGFGTIFAVSTSDVEKCEKAIEAGNIDKVRTLLKKHEGKNAQERKALLAQLALIAADVVEDRKDKLSLRGNLTDIVLYKEREKARDWALLVLGTGVATLGCWYAKDAYATYQDGLAGRSKRYGEFSYQSGMSLLGLSLGGYLASQGYVCSQQKSALKKAEYLETYLAELAKK